MKIDHVFHGKACVANGCTFALEEHRAPRESGRDKPRVDERKRADRDYFLGIDGEGQTDRETGKHLYVMLCAASEEGETYVREEPRGLSTVQCLEFLLDLPAEHSKAFAYSFGYDLTKILSDVDDLTLYKLFRPELRRQTIVTPKGARQVSTPLYWSASEGALPYSLNYLNGRFTVKRCIERIPTRDPLTRLGTYLYKWSKGRVIHDIWRFFQGKFTVALEDWKIPGDVDAKTRAELLAHMREMKDKRANFDKLSRDEIRKYCLDECRYMAQLARKLIGAHDKAEIPLKNYFSAGSSASAMLDVMGVGEHIQRSREENPTPEGVEHAVARAFFGGRFENSVVGPVPGTTFSYDLSSAYPYELCFLPCLIHGKWEHSTNRRAVSRARTAVVRYTLGKPRVSRTWAPFPFRLADGSIAFPESSGGGWVWRDEYVAGERLFPNVRFEEAWLYQTSCDCQPFTKGQHNIPGFYLERLRIGKEGPGIVIKLGTNSCYGKTCQFIGGQVGAFTSWVWAGLITSGCRAGILRAMALHKDLGNLLMVATDGLATRERLALPAPRNTGTFNATDENGAPVHKPLGGWEEKILKKGLFLARPGIYFPLDPTVDDVKQVRARGVGRSVVFEQYSTIVDAHAQAAARGDVVSAKVHVRDLSRFIGAKTAITRSGPESAYRYKRSKDFGQWITRPVEMSFNPLPKREGVSRDGRLGLRSFPDLESAPYRKSVVSPEARELKALTDEANEQPDGGDLTDYDLGDQGPE